MDRAPASTRSLFEQLTSAEILTEIVAIALAAAVSAAAAHFVRLWFRRLESRLDADSWQWKLLEGGVAVVPLLRNPQVSGGGGGRTGGSK